MGGRHHPAHILFHLPPAAICLLGERTHPPPMSVSVMLADVVLPAYRCPPPPLVLLVSRTVALWRLPRLRLWIDLENLWEVASVILAPLWQECKFVDYPRSRYMPGFILWVAGCSPQFVNRPHIVKGSFGLNFGVLKSPNRSLAVAVNDNIFVFRLCEYEVGCCKSFSSCICAEMNGFFGSIMFTVIYKHTCLSPVVIKLML